MTYKQRATYDLFIQLWTSQRPFKVGDTLVTSHSTVSPVEVMEEAKKLADKLFLDTTVYPQDEQKGVLNG